MVMREVSELTLVTVFLFSGLTTYFTAAVSGLAMVTGAYVLRFGRKLIAAAAVWRVISVLGVGETAKLPAVSLGVEVAIHLGVRLPRSISRGVAVSTGAVVALIASSSITRLTTVLTQSLCSALLLTSYWMEVNPNGAAYCFLTAISVLTARDLASRDYSLGGITAERTTAGLVAYWVAVTLAGLGLIHAFRDYFRRIVARKLFHFLAASIFLPGLLLSPPLLSLAFLLALDLFIAVEFLRKLPTFVGISHWFSAFIDERDQGEAAISHIFLLSACGFPLIFEEMTNIAGSRFVGVIVLCIGDSFAAIVGSVVGKHVFFRKKTWEGFTANLVSMAICCLCLSLPAEFYVLSLASALYEVVTTEIDNFSLPLFALSVLSHS